MKTYTQLREDIDLIGSAGGFDKVHSVEANRAFKTKRDGMIMNIGKIHKDYSLHREGDNGSMFITHDKTKKVIGRIYGEGSPKRFAVHGISVHPKHTKKKIGHSLAVAAYKHLHGMGVDVHSDIHQSTGGASVWNTLRKDPDTRKHVHVVRNKRIIGQASKMKTQDIWTSRPGFTRDQAAKKGIRSSSSEGSKGKKIVGVTLVLKGKKKR
jgi:hypothetical protein